MNELGIPQGPPRHVPAHFQALQLHALVQRDHQSWAQVALHPNAYPALLDWLDHHGDWEVRQAIAKRRGLGPPTPSSFVSPDPLGFDPATPKGSAETAIPLTTASGAATAAAGLASSISSRQIVDRADDKTVLASRSQSPLAQLSWGGQEPVALYRPLVVIGRGGKRVEDGAQFVRVNDPGRTVSGIHARLELTQGRWVVTDLDSTNGVFLLDGDREVKVRGSAEVEGGFYLGDVRFLLRSQSGQATQSAQATQPGMSEQSAQPINTWSHPWR